MRQLRATIALAASLDKARAKATAATEKALKLKSEADAIERRYHESLRAIAP